MLFRSIYVSNKFVTTKLSSSTNMFYNCTSIIGDNNTRYNSDYIDKTYARIDMSGFPGYFSVHKVTINYNVNGGQLASEHGETIGIKNNLVTLNNEPLTTIINYGETLGTSGLANYNNKAYINLIKEGYYVEKDKVWNNKADGSGKSYDQKSQYNASDFCDASKKDCIVTLYLNWKSSINPNDVEFKDNIVIIKKSSDLEVLKTVLNDDTIKVISNGQEIEDETKLKTGDILQYNSNEYEIAILGDTNKDGSITGSDITQTYSAYKRAITLTEAQRYAADTNEDGNITGSDITKMYSIYKGKVY